MPTPAPSLGYGQRAEAPINAVNQYMRAAPWYQSLIQSFGQDPNNVHLNDTQKQQVIRAAQANGITVDEGHNGQEVDDSGNFQAKSHTLRNTLMVAGIAGAALATMGAAGVFAGGAGAAGAGGAGAAGGGGLLASTTTAPLVGGLAAGGTGLAAGGAGAAGAAAAGGAAAGGAGGLSSSILGTAAKIGSAATALERGRAGGRIDEASINQRQDQLAQQGYSNDLAGARLNLAAPSERAHTSVQGDILANAKPFAFTGGTHMVGNIPVPNASGGLSPDLFSANTRALGTKMSADALADDSRLPYGNAVTPAPRPTALPQASGLDSILSTAGIVGGLSDMFGGDFSSALSRYGKKSGTNGVS